MTHTAGQDAQAPAKHAATPQPAPAPTARIVCPYCGEIGPSGTPCGSCGGRFDPLSRQATQNSMGPWYVRDPEHPHRPGASFETIARLARRGKITPDTILRGPTTHQFWTLAKWTPGVAELFGACHCCGEEVTDDAYLCAACGTPLQFDRDRQHLGLQPVRQFAGLGPAPSRPVVQGAPQVQQPPPTAVYHEDDSFSAPPTTAETAGIGPTSEDPVDAAGDVTVDAAPARRRNSSGRQFALAACLLVAIAGWATAVVLVAQRPAATPDEPSVPAETDTAESPAPNTETPAARTQPEPEPVVEELIKPEPSEPTLRDRVFELVDLGTIEGVDEAIKLLEAADKKSGLGEDDTKLLEMVRKRAERLRLRAIP
ncbi:MAG: hypothetical protein AAGI17_07725 [Planctomycetota bacterium]